MKLNFNAFVLTFVVALLAQQQSKAQITLLQNYANNNSNTIGTYQGINFKEAGFSGLYPIANTKGKEFWTVSDRGVNIDAANANPSGCHPTYDKIYAFPNYAPKIHRIRINGDSIQILQTITIKRPNGTGATGLINPTGLGSTLAEVPSTDTVLSCVNFNSKTVAKDVWGIDSEGILVDKDGNFWLCEEGGPTIWKLDANGVVIKRYTPYGNLSSPEPQDFPIDTVFKYRKNNRGFEGIAMTPNGKIYAIIQSPILYPSKSVGENSRVHRILEIDPATDAMRMLVYLNEGIIGTGGDQIRLKDWKIGDMAAINNDEFLVMEAAARGVTNIKKIYKINISAATAVTSGLYGGSTVEALIDETGLSANSITPVAKTLFMDLLANGWPAVLDKAEGLAIINDSTIAVSNDNDYGQMSAAEDGVATATGNKSHLLTYNLKGINKLSGYSVLNPTLNQGQTGLSSSQTPYLQPASADVEFKSILTTGDVVNGYTMCGTPDGMGAFDNGDGTFTVVLNHEFGNTSGAVRAHGSKGSFVSKWIINKSDMSVVSGSDLMQNVKLWNGTSYDTYNSGNPSSSAAFARFCSADLPAVSAFYNSTTGLGTQERIFMNGEESGSEGRAMAHIVTGSEAGTSYELPALGNLSMENQVACPSSGDKTVVVGMDDATPGQVYFYVGTKTNTGTAIEKAGLTNGNLYGVSVTGMSTETNGSVPEPGTAFTLVDLGDVTALTGATINTNSNNNGVTTFLRPEDGAWDPSTPSDFYFATTNGFSNPSRLWRLRLTDVTNPTLGGTIEAVLDGTEGQKMLDNITIDHYGHVLMVEDVGGNAHIGKVWQYTIATDELKQVGKHDETRFLSGGANFLTEDEEASGVLDVQEILGAGMFLIVDQAHYSQPGELVEGGQMLSFYNPDTYNANPEVSVVGNSIEIASGSSVATTVNDTDFGTITSGTSITKMFTVSNAGPGSLKISSLNFTGVGASMFSLVSAPAFPITIAANSSQLFTVQYAPSAAATHNATVELMTNDFDEATYTFALKGIATTSTNVNTDLGTSFVNLYPNPSGDIAYISMLLPNDDQVEIRVYDVQGMEVLSSINEYVKQGESQFVLNTSTLKNGVYFVKVSTTTKSQSIKTVIVH
jgi:hypothetical protein